MPWNVFLIPLLGGFVFIHRCNLYRYRSQRLEGERLLLQSAICGVVLLALARLFTWSAVWTAPGLWLQQCLFQLVPAKDAPYLGTAITALAGGELLARAANLCLRGWRAKAWIVSRWDHGLLRLFMDALRDDEALSITLKNRKVYIGYVWKVPEHSPHDRFVTLLLLLSGYRDPDTLEMVHTVNYADSQPDPDEEPDTPPFTVTFSLDEVLTANCFDLARFELEFADHKVVAARA